MDLKRAKYIIFDFDGVIADTEKGRFKVLTDIFNKKGISLKSHCSVEELQGKSTKQYLKEKFPDLASSIIKDILTERRNLFFNNLEKYCLVYPGVRETITDLHHHGFKLILATSNDSFSINVLLEFIGIKGYFKSILAREQTENVSLGLKDYQLVMKVLKINPKDCIVIEDSLIGVYAAKRANLFTIAFDRYKNTTIHQKADVVVYSYDELRNFIGI